MAFGDLKGGVTAISVAANSITNPTDAVGSVAVALGDLIFVVVGEQTSVTATTVTDNLGNGYSATNAGTVAGTSTGRAYYSRVTVAGTLTTVHVAATGSTHNVAIDACVFTGPFLTSPLDANPANITTQVTSPFTAPATGTLAQPDELVVSWAVATGSTVWSATSPNTLGAQTATQAILHTVIGYQTVGATTTVSPAFTAGSNPTDSVLGTSSFKQDEPVWGNTLYLTRSQWGIPRTHLRDFSVQATFQDDTSESRNPFVLRRLYIPFARQRRYASQSTPTDTGGPSLQTLTPSLFTNTNTFYAPTVTLQELPAGSVPAPRWRKLPVPRHKDESLAGSIAFDQTLTPSLYTNTSTFYQSTVSLQELPAAAFPPPHKRVLPPIPRHKAESVAGSTAFDQTLTPSLYTNVNTFYQPIVSLQELPAGAVPPVRRRILPIPRHKNENVAGSTSFDQTLTPSLYANVNTFYVPIVTLQELPAASVAPVRRRILPVPRHKDENQAGSTSFDQTLTPSLYTNVNIFYQPTVSLQELPAASVAHVRRRVLPIPRHKNENVAGSTSFDQTLTSSLYTNTNTFFSPTVTPGEVTLSPSLYTNTNSFYQPVVTLQELPAASVAPIRRRKTPPAHRDFSTHATQIFDQSLLPSLFTNDNVFYAPMVAKEGVNLLPDTYINTNIFYAPTVTTGNVDLDPSLYTNVNTFYSPVVNLQELPAAVIPLIRNRVLPRRHLDSTISAPVLPEAVTLSPSLYTNDNTFYDPAVTEQEVVSRSAYRLRRIDKSNWHRPHVDFSVQGNTTVQSLFPSLYIDDDAFYTPTVNTQGQLFPDLYTNDNTFYTHIISIAETLNREPFILRRSHPRKPIVKINVNYSQVIGGSQTLSPDLYANNNSFYSPTVTQFGFTTYATTLLVGRTRPLRRSVSVSTPLSTIGQGLSPSLYTNINTFYTPTILEGNTLFPSHYTNNNTFYTPTITQGPATLHPSLYVNVNILPGPSVVIPPPPPPPTIVGGVVGQGYRPQKRQDVTTNGILFFVSLTLIPGVARTISLLPGNASISVSPGLQPFENNVETAFKTIGVARGTDFFEDNMDDLMLILSEILVE